MKQVSLLAISLTAYKLCNNIHT